MVSRQRSDTAINAPRMIPTKWAIVLVAMLIGYVLLQPRLNQWFGWKLPSVAGLVGDEKPITKKEAKPTAAKPAKTAGTSSDLTGGKESKVDASPDKVTHKDDTDSQDKVHGILNDLGRNRFESPEGLIYGPGSEEGHRIKHIERHLEDQPSRPGSHGVFKGEMQEFLEAIDRTFAMAKEGSKGTSKKENEGAIVYEASFEKSIGFLGGMDGKRRKNPALKKMRVVVRGKSVITAFPVQ
jgi:hypothetical protein